MKVNTKRSSYTFIPLLGIVVNSEIEDEFLSLYPGEIDEVKIIEKLQVELSDEEIEDQICSLRNITLNISEQCNFRCRYCSFSGIYEVGHIHNAKKMTLKTAQKAIDYLLNLAKNKKRNQKNNTLTVSNYGGEAILEFELIKDIVKYAREKLVEIELDKTYKFNFRLSTNGYLLDREEILDFLVKNDFNIDISLDGPKEEHDKFRLTRYGKETWGTIWNNINNIYINHPKFYSEKVSYIITLHPWHDFKKIDDFFIERPSYFDLQSITANLVSDAFLKESVKNIWFDKNLFQQSELININANKRIQDRLTLRKIDLNTTFTNMCFPGGIKLFVTSDGKYFICERIKQNIPIGDVDNGLDFDAIRKIQRLWNEEIIRNRCWECPAWAFCNVCAAQSENKDEIRIDCRYKHQVKKVIYDYIVYKEEEDKYTNSKQSIIDIKEYIKQLE